MQQHIADVTALATMGALSTTQDIVHVILSEIEGAEADLVAEETLCLTAIGTARAADVGLRGAPEVAQAVVPALLHLPYTYRDYIVGSAMIAEEDTEMEAAAAEITRRLQRKQEFYAAHLPEGQFPGRRLLSDKMELWMGRISPPKLPTTPAQRLEELQLAPKLQTHLRLVLSYMRQHSE